MKLCSFETAKTATIDGCIDLDGTRAPVNAAIIRDPSTTAIPNLRRLSTQTLLAVAGAYPLKEGESIHIGGLLPHSRSSEMATITWTGKRGRKITVERASSGQRGWTDRLLHLECKIGVRTLDYPLEKATDGYVVRTICLELQRKENLAAAGPIMDDRGNILIPQGAVTPDGRYYPYQAALQYRPRLFAWHDGYQLYNIGQLMKVDPKLGKMARGFFDALPPRQKARALALAIAA